MVLYWLRKIVEWDEYGDYAVGQVVVHEGGKKLSSMFYEV